jgi:CheY-like chemotaxis protein
MSPPVRHREAGRLGRTARLVSDHLAFRVPDLEAEDVDGWSLAEALRCMLSKAITLVAVTSRDEPDERERSRIAGFDKHLVRPVSPNQVHQTLRQIFAH